MKLLILASLLISTSAFSENWMPISQIKPGSVAAYSLQSSCPGQCLDVGSEPQAVTLGFVEVRDNYLKADEQSCEDDADCSTKFLALVCSENGYEKIKNLELLQVYCAKFAGKVLVRDNSGWTGYKAGQAQLAAYNAGKNQVKKLRECLIGVIDVLVLRNASKNLSIPQVEQMVATYQPIQDLLYAASGATAKLKISEVVADGVLVTENDKTALIQEIDKCSVN